MDWYKNSCLPVVQKPMLICLPHWQKHQLLCCDILDADLKQSLLPAASHRKDHKRNTIHPNTVLYSETANVECWCGSIIHISAKINDKSMSRTFLKTVRVVRDIRDNDCCRSGPLLYDIWEWPVYPSASHEEVINTSCQPQQADEICQAQINYSLADLTRWSRSLRPLNTSWSVQECEPMSCQSNTIDHSFKTWMDVTCEMGTLAALRKGSENQTWDAWHGVWQHSSQAWNFQLLNREWRFNFAKQLCTEKTANFPWIVSLNFHRVQEQEKNSTLSMLFSLEELIIFPRLSVVGGSDCTWVTGRDL